MSNSYWSSQPIQWSQETLVRGIPTAPSGSDVAGDMYLDTTYSVLMIFDGVKWMPVSSNAPVLGIMNYKDKETLLEKKKLVLDKTFLLVSTAVFYHLYEYDIISELRKIGIDLLWHNDLSLPEAGLHCIIVNDIDDANLIRVTYEGFVTKILDMKQLFEDLENVK